MAQKDSSFLLTNIQSKESKKRSALGVGVTTMVTVMVVLLLAAFAVLSLVSARSNHNLSEMAANQAQLYYAADMKATLWYAELDLFVANLSGDPETFEKQLTDAGYVVFDPAAEELRITQEFDLSAHRRLVVTIAINDDKTTTIRQWQA